MGDWFPIFGMERRIVWMMHTSYFRLGNNYFRVGKKCHFETFEHGTLHYTIGPKEEFIHQFPVNTHCLCCFLLLWNKSKSIRIDWGISSCTYFIMIFFSCRYLIIHKISFSVFPPMLNFLLFFFFLIFGGKGLLKLIDN